MAVFDLRGDDPGVVFFVAGEDMLTGAGAHLGMKKAHMAFELQQRVVSRNIREVAAQLVRGISEGRGRWFFCFRVKEFI